jgi:hypothetical protein
MTNIHLSNSRRSARRCKIDKISFLASNFSRLQCYIATFLHIKETTETIMSTHGDLEMADATVGADVNDTEVELVEPQRIRVVSLLFTFFLHKFFAFCRLRCNDTTNCKKYTRANLIQNSCLDQPILPLHSNSPRKITLLEMLYDTLS